jgi:hypothetical protein
VLTWGKHLALHLHLLILVLFSIGLDSPWNKLSGKSKITEIRVQSRKLWLFSWGDLCCLWEGGSAAFLGWQCRTCIAIMASFRVQMASLSGVNIYTHPCPLVVLLTSRPSKTHPKPCESSPQPSLCESEVLSEWLSVGAVWLWAREQMSNPNLAHLSGFVNLHCAFVTLGGEAS